jgi:hypothetical protein
MQDDHTRSADDLVARLYEAADAVEDEAVRDAIYCERTVHLSLAEYISLDGNRTRLIAHTRVDRKHASSFVR